MLYIAQFHPQAWINDNATIVDCEGPAFFDVTEVVEACRGVKEKEALLETDSDASDALRDAPTAPRWMRDWDGPFYIKVHEKQFCSEDEWRNLSFRAKDSARAVAGEAEVTRELVESIPDSDGLWARGFRDGVESIVLALKASGTCDAHVFSALRTAIDAYSNNDADPSSQRAEIRESLVVSTAHLTKEEGQAFASGGGASTGLDLGSHFCVTAVDAHISELLISGFDDQSQLCEAAEAHAQANFSEGLCGVIRKAASLGCPYVVFHADGPYLPGLPINKW
jgi:hypothetical protein